MIWTGAKKSDGSGLFVENTWPDRRCTGAQRYAYRYYIGPIPDDHYVTSKCGNRLCCTATHLRTKSASETIRASIKAGRWTQLENKNLPPVKCGADNPNGRYSDEFVNQIRSERARGDKLIQIATRHGLPMSRTDFLCSRRKGGMM